MISISRRRFLALAGGLAVTGCSVQPEERTGTAPTPTSRGTSPTTTSTIPGTVTTVTSDSIDEPQNVLVLVELRGGNDAVNTLPPLTGTYRDLRPSIAIAEADVLRHDRLPGHGLHPSLAPLLAHLDTGRLGMVAGVGFAEPNRSHFVSIDRWARADRMDDEFGWLGRWLDTLPEDLPSLGATALGGTGETLLGATRKGTVINGIDAFAFPSVLSNGSIRQLGGPPPENSSDPLLAAAHRAFLDSVGATEEFDTIADAARQRVPESDSAGLAPATGAFSTGLAVAAEMIVGDVGTRVVTVSVNGFDTHSDQLDQHSMLLTDLATGLSAFWSTLDDAGASDRVLVATTSEFGRRVAENASRGCDHGAAGVSLLMGNSVNAGLTGRLDTNELLDGDLRPQIDPRVILTACLDWLDADVERVLGRRYDDVQLLA